MLLCEGHSKVYKQTAIQSINKQWRTKVPSLQSRCFCGEKLCYKHKSAILKAEWGEHERPQCGGVVKGKSVLIIAGKSYYKCKTIILSPRTFFDSAKPSTFIS